MNPHFGTIRLAKIIGRQGGDRLDRVQASLGSVPGEGGDGVAEFTDDVDESMVGMERQMARAGAGFGFGEGRIVGRYGCGCGIELKDQDLIGPEVAADCPMVGWIDIERMRVRPGLPLGDRSATWS